MLPFIIRRGVPFMSIKIAVPQESAQGETRVGCVPDLIAKYQQLNCQIHLQHNAGLKANFPDQLFQDVTICDDFAQCVANAAIILKVSAPTLDEIAAMPEGAILVSFLAAHKNDDIIKKLAQKEITSFAMELIPRITRAQSIDALSSQASIAGYKAALLAANQFDRFFPMLTTAAGTSKPAKVLVIGAGVAGLQAIATAKRLGALVQAYDIRPEAREQVESLGAKMVKLDIDARGEGGYARELTAEEKQQQQAILKDQIAKSDIVISTAAIPGRNAPKIIFKDMVEAMPAGAVIIDLAAESGGNCELTQPGKTITHHQVTIVGPVNLPASVARDASNMYARNLYHFTQLLMFDNELKPDFNDDILKASMVTHNAEITHAATRQRLKGE